MDGPASPGSGSVVVLTSDPSQEVAVVSAAAFESSPEIFRRGGAAGGRGEEDRAV